LLEIEEGSLELKKKVLSKYKSGGQRQKKKQ